MVDIWVLIEKGRLSRREQESFNFSNIARVFRSEWLPKHFDVKKFLDVFCGQAIPIIECQEM